MPRKLEPGFMPGTTFSPGHSSFRRFLSNQLFTFLSTFTTQFLTSSPHVNWHYLFLRQLNLNSHYLLYKVAPQSQWLVTPGHQASSHRIEERIERTVWQGHVHPRIYLPYAHNSQGSSQDGMWTMMPTAIFQEAMLLRLLHNSLVSPLGTYRKMDHMTSYCIDHETRARIDQFLDSRMGSVWQSEAENPLDQKCASPEYRSGEQSSSLFCGAAGLTHSIFKWAFFLLGSSKRKTVRSLQREKCVVSGGPQCSEFESRCPQAKLCPPALGWLVSDRRHYALSCQVRVSGTQVI